MADQQSEKQHCANCSTRLNEGDNFCPNCGQQNRDFRIGFWHLMLEFLSNNFNFDTKLGRTALALVTKPGKLTKDFNEGKRAAYVKPLQMYFFVSFVFFLLIGVLDTDQNVDADLPGTVNFTVDGEQTDLLEMANNDSIDGEQSVRDLAVELFDADSTETFKHKLASQLIRITDPQGREQLIDALYSNISIAMFMLMPWFAALLWLTVRKQDPFYIDALIFSIHFHSVAFILLILESLYGLLHDSDITLILFGMLMLIYLTASLKTSFGLTWKRASTRAILLSVLHLFSFSIMWIGVLLISFWLF